jgi:hypothetical protein
MSPSKILPLVGKYIVEIKMKQGNLKIIQKDRLPVFGELCFSTKQSNKAKK